ncbi:MAG: HAD-IIB family hydrolase [Pseudomonadales bacterium]
MSNTLKSTVELAGYQILIFTDLDGSLLDHNNYSFEPAVPLLQKLEEHSIPVICCTSKTLAELLPLREILNNRHPFIVENGAGVFIPKGYFVGLDAGELLNTEAQWPQLMSDDEGYLGFSFCQPRVHWQHLLQQLPSNMQSNYRSFQSMGIRGIIDATGLSPEKAEQANQRLFSEPLLWQGSEEVKANATTLLKQLGANVLQGGRFVHISGACNKATALNWLAALYQRNCSAPISSIAIGDSDNDISMLEVADRALVIRSPAHTPPQLERSEQVYLSHAFGPDGWVEGIQFFLQEHS